MKLIKFSCACAAIALSSSAFSQVVDEIKITGTRDSSGSTTTKPTGVYREETRPSVETPGQAQAMRDRDKKVAEETAKAKEKAKKKCFADADQAEKKCNDAYDSLNKLCNFTASVLGRGAAWTAGKLYGITATELADLKTAASLGGFTGTIAGLNPPAWGCDKLSERSKDFCAAGGAKIKERQCNAM